MSKKSREVIIYKSADGLAELSVQLEDETVWLTIDQMAELFDRNKSTISRHIKNIFGECELQKESVVANFATTAADGKTYQVDYYNLDVIISVGYRVKSIQGTRFRQWATQRLKEYMVKGFPMDDDRYWKEDSYDFSYELFQVLKVAGCTPESELIEHITVTNLRRQK